MFNKKICILTSTHQALDDRIFDKEAKTLADNGYDVTLVAQHDKDETIDGIKIIALPKPQNRFFRILFLAHKIYRLALKQKSDIYHFHDPGLLPWAIRLKRKNQVRVIYDVHEDVPRQILSKSWLPKVIRWPIAKFFNLYEKGAAKKLDYIIAATPDIESNFKQDNVIDIKNYPIISDLQPLNNQEVRQNKNYYTLIYIGGLEIIRGTKETIKALSIVNSKYNIKLKLLGRFSEKKFEQEIGGLEGWRRVEFLGWLPRQEVYKELSMADIGLVCLYPLRRFLTSLPVKLFEYMAIGLPVIASNFPLWREIVEGNNCGICVNPLDSKEIAKAIEYLIEHPKEAKEMGENGQRATLEKYNWKSEGKKLLEIYEKLLK